MVVVVVVVVIVVYVSAGGRRRAVDVYDDIGNDNEQQNRESSQMSTIMKPGRGESGACRGVAYTVMPHFCCYWFRNKQCVCFPF